MHIYTNAFEYIPNTKFNENRDFINFKILYVNLETM